MEPKTVLITGGTGLIGRALTNHLTCHGYKVIILSRHAQHHNDKDVSYATWDVNAGKIDAQAIASADHIIHLAGAGVADKRWTAKRKTEIVESRTHSSTLLVKTLSETPNKVQSIIAASAIGWYGDDKKAKGQPFTEDMLPDRHFLGETCRLWEDSIKPVERLSKRLVRLRTGIVLSPEGGALRKFIKPIRFSVAGILGNGNQMISWIHIEDLCRMYRYAIENDTVSGAFNAVAPMPVTNKDLTMQLAQKIRGNFFISLHVPRFVLKLMLGEMSIEILKSATVSCEKIRSTGFTFLFPSVGGAIQNLVN